MQLSLYFGQKLTNSASCSKFFVRQLSYLYKYPLGVDTLFRRDFFPVAKLKNH